MVAKRVHCASVRQISGAIVHLNQSKKQHPILICDEAHLLPHPALEQLPLLLNFDMDSSRLLTLLLIGQPLLRRLLVLQFQASSAIAATHRRAISLGGTDAPGTRRVSGPATQSGRRRRVVVQRDGAPRALSSHQRHSAPSQQAGDDALRLAAERNVQMVDEAVLLDATTEALL